MSANRRAEDKIELEEPQTTDEAIRQIWRDMRSIKTCVFGENGLKERTTVLETIVKVIAWTTGIGFAALGAVGGWIVLIKKNF